MDESIVHNVTLAGGRASGRATENIVGVFTLCDQSRTTVIRHAGEYVSLCLIALRERHAVGLGELVQQVADLHCLFQKSA